MAIPLLPFQNPFRSFWMGGYECSDQLNAFGNRVDMLTITGHIEHLETDYRNLEAFGIKTVREGIRWSYVEKIPYQYDWTTVRRMIRAAKASGIQQIWDICHFGYPDDLTPLHPMFARRFAHVCGAFVQLYREMDPDSPLIVTPINEVSFISWLGGDARGTVPYCTNQGWEVKYHLMKAYIEGIHAMKAVDPSVLILTTEPLVNMVPPLNPTPEDIEAAREQNELQFQSLDILAGRICPELGGSMDCIDLLGLNFYYNNQWIVHSTDFLPWFNEVYDPRWKPLSELLFNAYERYKVPLVISETSHCKDHRPNWIEFIGNQLCDTLKRGVPVVGACLYPLVDRPDWDQLDDWHNAGLWDLCQTDGVGTNRILYEPYARELIRVQAQVEAVMNPLPAAPRNQPSIREIIA